jgi:rhomboid protease GluP
MDIRRVRVLARIAHRPSGGAPMTLLAILVLAAFAVYVMNDAERARVLGFLLRGLGVARRAAAANVRAKGSPFQDALNARTSWAGVTGTIAAINVFVFLSMLVAPGSLSDPETLAAWGANYGPRTTNGEWWRLVTATVVHPGLFHALVNTVALVQAGWILERLVGHFAFGAVYITAGTIASVVALSASPMSVALGGSAAVYGLYGMLAAVVFWGTWQPSPLTIPLAALRSLAPGAAVFVLFNLFTGALDGSAEMTGFALGLGSGLVLSRRVSLSTPPPRLVAAALAATILIAGASTLFLAGMADVRPEIQRILALEERTAALYDKAVQQFRLGAMNATALAQLIDRAIVPEVQAAHARLKTITGVPYEHRPLVANADEYLRLRTESWRLRSDALQKANMVALRKADSTEHASLEAFQRLRPAEPGDGGIRQ